LQDLETALDGSHSKMPFRFLAVVLILAASAAAQTPVRPAATHYRVVPLPFRPSRINDSGVIAGSTEDHMPAVWTEKDGLRQLGLPPGFTATESLGLNRAGDVAGTATREGSSEPVAFQSSGGKVSLLSDERSKATAINGSGEIVGQSSERIVAWHKGKSIPLGGCCGGIAHAVNNRGQIVGQFNDKAGRFGAFLWEPDQGLRSIAPAQGTNSTALAINDAAHVLVQSFSPNAVFLWQGGKFTDVQLSDEFASQPLALNNQDVIVGEFGAASDFNHAFLWDRQHGFRDLNHLIDASSDWVLESAFDVNDWGEIVGIGDHGNDQDVGFLLVPETTAATRPTK